MTSGAALKTKLGLDKIERVYMTRVLGLSAVRTFMVVYDSRRPTFPIPTAYINGPHSPFLSRYPFDKKLKVLPLAPIENYKFDPMGAMIMVVDISGRFGDLAKAPIAIESVGSSMAARFDERTLYDLKNADNIISAITKKYKKQRTQLMGRETGLAKLNDVWVDTRHDSITLLFSTPATKTPAQQTFPSAGYGLHPNFSGRYVIMIKVLKFFSWLHTNPDKNAITVEDVKEVLKVADIKISSTSPSFYWQGFAWTLTQLGAALYPVKIPPEIWGPRHNFALLDKHLAGIIRSVDYFIPIIANTVTGKLRAKGLMPKHVHQRKL